MEGILSLAILGILIIIFWKPVMIWAGVLSEKTELRAKESQVDLQPEYKQLHDKIISTRNAHNGKYFTMSDIESEMHSVTDPILQQS